MNREYMCVYRLTFRDGGEPEYGVLHSGDKDSCERVAAIVPAISYSGPRKVHQCHLAVIEEPVTR